MRRAARGGIPYAHVVFLVATPLVALSAQTTKTDTDRPDVVITEADYAKTISVKKGNLIEVRLKAGLRSYWAQEHPNANFRKRKGPKSEPEPRVGSMPSLDGRYICVNLFEVVSDSAASVTSKLMYCSPPSQAERLAQVKPKDPTDLAFWTRQRLKRKEITQSEFRPDMDATKLKEGMVFQASFQTKDAPSAEQKSSSTR